MRLKAIVCQVFTREFEDVLTRSPHAVDLESIPMGLHTLGVEMRPHLQERIDAADAEGYDAILLGYALCGRGTEGLRAGRTKLVLPRAHDCIGILMGSRHSYQRYFDDHPGVYYRSPGWVEFQTPDLKLEPAFPSQKSPMGENSTREELVAKYGEENGAFLYEQFSAFRHNYTGLTYISSGIAGDDAFRTQARAEAAANGWKFEDVTGSTTLLQRLVDGDWDNADFLVVPPGSAIRANMSEDIVEAATDPR
jgi:hypothetical protein